MESLRRARHLVRFVLAWFVLALGVAAASPLIQPQAMELVCASDSQVKLMVLGDDGAVELGASHLDCPLCLVASAPPPLPFVAPQPPRLPARGWTVLALAPLPSAAALPWQARAPPSFS